MKNKKKKLSKEETMRGKLHNFYDVHREIPIEEQDPTGIHRAFSKFMGEAYQRKIAKEAKNKLKVEDGK